MGNPYAPNLQLYSTLQWHLARRVAIAPTSQLVGEINKAGYAGWIDQQLNYQSIPDPAWDALYNKYFTILGKSIAEQRRLTQNRPWMVAPILTRSIYLRHQCSNRYLHDHMTEFFSDLLYVAATSDKANSWVANYDRDVLRKHSLGKFSDMLYAAMTHVAMLRYLDNELNTKDNPNENLGRELLELHSVGVGNYTETDVRQSTLLLTGHGVNWDTFEYEYHPWDHYVGPIKIMGFSHPNGSAGVGPDALRAYTNYLATHPATAKRIATRLYQRFVADIPETGPTTSGAALINQMATTYTKSGTDIKPVLRQLFNSAEFKNSIGQKWRRPQEVFSTMMRNAQPVDYVTSSNILTDPWDFGWLGWAMYNSGHFPRAWAVVNGYPDDGPSWLSANVMRANINVAENVAFHWDQNYKFDRNWSQIFNIAPGQNAVEAARRLTASLTGYTWAPGHLNLIAAWLYDKGQSPVTSTSIIKSNDFDYNINEAVRLVFSSPYFMVR